MDALGDILAPYSDIIGKVAGGITTLQFLSGIALLNDIRKKGRSDEYPPERFIIGLVLPILTTKMGSLIGDSTTTNTNVLGFAINFLSTAVYYYYASDEFRPQIHKTAAISGIFTLACLAYAALEDPEKIVDRFGMLMSIIMAFLVGLPLLDIKKVVAKKSTEGMPFPVIMYGAVVMTSWTLYSISIRNAMMTYQNLFLLALNSLQLALFAIYPSTPSVPAVSSLPGDKTAISSESSNDTKKTH